MSPLLVSTFKTMRTVTITSPFLPMGFHCFISLCFFFILSSSSLIHAQQPYVGKGTTDCGSKSISVLGYTCNGQRPSCQSYLIFRSQPPYNTVSSISNLLAANASQLAEINSVSNTATFETNKEVIVPVTCSCSGQNYQANTSYLTRDQDTMLLLANNTFQGLSTCQAIRVQNNITGQLLAGSRITAPIRCACPTRNQTNEGVNFLLSYIVTWGDFVSTISQRFGADTGRTLEANELSFQNAGIFPFTTLLVPLQNPPSSLQTITPPPPPSQLTPPQSSPSTPSGKKSKTWVYIVIGVVVGALVLLVSIVVLCAFFRRRKRLDDQTRTPTTTDHFIESQSFESYEKPLKMSEEESEEFLESISDIAQSLKVYKFQELQSATEDFSPKCWVKGSVYRGTINGNLAAIKKTNRDVSKEINLLNKINHFNLIRLSGVCFSEGNWYLVFEYAVNGSLTDWICNSGKTNMVLSWVQRVQIAMDVAAGLDYLHSYTSPPHVHKDIKTSNILLDSDFRAKIANLSLARSADGQQGEFALTRHIVGTKGYMAPEYLENGLVSPKLDVYSLGIVMLEVITGNAIMNKSDVNLKETLIAILNVENPKEKLKDFVDPSLQGNYPLDLALLLARLTESCLKKEPAARPNMDEIVQTLSNISATSSSWEKPSSV